MRNRFPAAKEMRMARGSLGLVFETQTSLNTLAGPIAAAGEASLHGRY